MTFSSQRSKYDQDEGVGGPSLNTLNEDPGAKLRKTFNLEDFKSEFRLIKVLFFSFKSQIYTVSCYCERGALGFKKENSITCINCLVKKFSTNLDCLDCLRSRDADANYSLQA